MANEQRLYSIGQVTPTVILKDTGRAVNGFVIEFTIIDLDEIHTLQFDSMNKDLIDDAIRAFIDDRMSLIGLG